jgi:hypothetical protein
VENIKDTIQAQKQHIVCSDVLNILELIDHEELGKNGQCLKPDTEAPNKVDRVKGLMNDNCES